MHIQCVRSGCMQHVQFHIGRRFHLPLLLLVETRVRRNDKTAGTGGWELKLFTSSVINLYLYEGAGFAILNNFRDVRKRLRREILRKIGFSLENHLQYMCNLFFEKNLYCYIINSLLLIINSF